MMSAADGSGETRICSIVPRSSSRTMEKAVEVVRMTIRMKAMSPGTRNLALLSSGLYQTRTSVWSGRVRLPNPRRSMAWRVILLRIALEDGRGVARRRRPAQRVRAVEDELDVGAPAGQQVLGESAPG